jgi:hypothetical protein
MDQVMRDVEKRGKKWMQVKQDREWEDRDRWRFLCNSQPKKLETTLRKKKKTHISPTEISTIVIQATPEIIRNKQFKSY